MAGNECARDLLVDGIHGMTMAEVAQRADNSFSQGHRPWDWFSEP